MQYFSACLRILLCLFRCGIELFTLNLCLSLPLIFVLVYFCTVSHIVAFTTATYFGDLRFVDDANDFTLSLIIPFVLLYILCVYCLH